MQSFFHYSQYLIIRAYALGARFLSHHLRRKVAFFLAHILHLAPPVRKRLHSNLTFIFPEKSETEINEYARETLGYILWGYMDVLNNDQFDEHGLDIEIVSEHHDKGLTDVISAFDDQTGIVGLSAHFGQWEIIRHYLKANGYEFGAIYKTNSNTYYNEFLKINLEAAGRPLAPNGVAGFSILVKHLKAKGAVAILADQRYPKGTDLDFMGHPARTSLVPAELALKYDVPLIPIFAARATAANSFKLHVFPPIPHTNAREMMTVYNQNLAEMIKQYPAQWYWLHARWGRRIVNLPNG